ncbi:MAG: protocatechuate 3,4-dioxygenase subunit beta [Proteobacteria bacterium]|nr:protocatechuate 3,4-dioxygenase subunit beta [Pseudomonadota bacterium]
MTSRDWSQHPPYLCPDYQSSVLRGPTRPLLKLAPLYRQQPSIAGELLGRLTDVYQTRAIDCDLTKNGPLGGEPIGERIIVSGRVMDETGSAVAGALVEIWQANASGRYLHKVDQHHAPRDPNFIGAGRVITNRDGHYRFYTIKPGAYPWGNHVNAWRPQHIHFSVLGATIATRLVTQMYFPGDPLLELDPIFQAVPASAQTHLIAQFDLGLSQADFALGYHFDIVLGRPGTQPADTQG